MGKSKGYDVFVLAGGSCIPKILKKSGYEGAIGVACSDELKMAGDYLERLGLSGQAVPLTKNGCANTKFSLDTLRKVMSLS